MNEPAEKKPFPTPVLALAAVLVLGLGAWLLLQRPPPNSVQDPLPGNPVNVHLGRAAVEIEGDSADPLESAEAVQGGKPLAVEAAQWDQRWRALAFFDPDAGPVKVRVKTRHREAHQTLEPGTGAETLALTRVDLGWTEGMQTWGVPDTAVAFSPDARLIAVGAATGDLKLLPFTGASEKPGKPVLDRKIPEGLIKDLAFTADGATLLVGEQSPDANVYAFDTQDGKERWTFSLAKELGNERSPGRDSVTFYSLPTVMRILPLEGGDILVLGLHSWKAIVADKEEKRTRCRVYRLNAATGEVRWRYPAGQPADRNITWIAADPAGTRVVGVQSIPGAGQVGAASATLDVLALDGTTGAETGRLSFEPLKGFTSTYAWQALALTPGGEAGVVGAGDGRVWAFGIDAQGKLAIRWQAGPGHPIQVGGTEYHCSIGWGEAAKDLAFVTVGQSSVQFGTQAPKGYALDLHPEAMTVQAFAFQPAEKEPFVWRFDAPGDPQGLWLSPGARWLALAYQKQEGVDAAGNPTPPDYGVAILDVTKQADRKKRFVLQHATEGPVFFKGTFSKDGRYLAVVEGPRRGADKLSATRTYRVWVLH
ncbi:MAG: PQQ-binding-like beta-propeller repeat protein [Planctomycetota bacterium]|nr:PQQ-binding-like beta-propeller repeat protein [Planctomycetota bacterium]